ncbi:L,D-transpeptidase family protein [Flavisolibacter ginsenosidimutans]|uniref:L,D-transpeptidase family protein n=1 Tax=Flavisolibacter ginsenosidimutans TaxID=661481 RepID=UPI00155A3009|nr:L,D-transpeptidase family protein [Flavisolibacter ginsenosidimutans]
MRTLVLSIFLCFSFYSFGQGTQASFVDFQRGFSRPSVAMQNKLDTLQKQFLAKGLQWPVKFMYIRSFKYDGQLEVWVSNGRKEPFKLFKTYRVCAMAGSLGPKRMEGDYQVPEGFYYINEFNPNSNYYLSLGINYPNTSDRILSDPVRPGGDIYIHGNCVTVGCIPINDQQIEELYTLAAHAKSSGQDFIPVHIFPVRYSNRRSADYLAELTKKDEKLKIFASKLEAVYDHFEATHQLPVIMTDNQGEYQFDGLTKKIQAAQPVAKPRKASVHHRQRVITQLVDVVLQWPQFQGGGQAFLKYLDQLGKSVSASLPQGVTKANVVVEFIVDTDGVPTNFKMIQGVNEAFDDDLITVLEQMPQWEPAILDGKPVAKKLRQSFVVSK